MQRMKANQINAWLDVWLHIRNTNQWPNAESIADEAVASLDRRGAFDDDVMEVPRAEDMGHGVSGVQASAVGDVVKVPPHWHVKFSAMATPKSGADILPGDVLEFVHRNEPRHATIECHAREDNGLVIFDVVLPFPLPINTEARFRWPRSGVADKATVVSVY